MTQEANEFDDLEDMLLSSLAHATRMRAANKARREARSHSEVSQDYAERLAEKATFRRLLSDEALDGVRFRWLWAHWDTTNDSQVKWVPIDALRAWIDAQIGKEERKNGPSA
jgi:hypothetical protein